MTDSQNQIREALAVLNDYYRVFATEIASEIITHKADFESPGLGQVEGLVERYAKHAQRVNALYGILTYEAGFSKPQGKEPLARNEFRCFGCGEVIQPEDTACKLCGWTWR